MKYNFSMIYTGVMDITVTADNEDEAYEKILDAFEEECFENPTCLLTNLDDTNPILEKAEED